MVKKTKSPNIPADIQKKTNKPVINIEKAEFERRMSYINKLLYTKKLSDKKIKQYENYKAKLQKMNKY